MNWPWERAQSTNEAEVDTAVVQVAVDALEQQMQQMQQAVAAVSVPTYSGISQSNSTYTGTGNITFGSTVSGAYSASSGTGLTTYMPLYTPLQTPAPQVEFSLMKLSFDASAARYDAERKGVVLTCWYGPATVEVFIPMDIAQQVLGPVLLEAFK